MKRILIGLGLGLLIVVIACIPNLGTYLVSFLIPPRLYIVLAVVGLIILYSILRELRKRNGGNS